MDLSEILEKINFITESITKEEAKEIDRNYKWPEDTLRAIQKAGLAGLVVPKEYNGLGKGLLGLAKACEVIGKVSGSAAICFGMHCVGSAVISSKATPAQRRSFIDPIVQGEHLTTLALSEPGTGANFYFPQTQLLSINEGEYQVNGSKTFVTNGGMCDSYVISTVGVEAEASLDEFSCLIVESSRKGLEWGPDWKGIGMKGNSSKSLNLNNVVVPLQNIIGAKGDQLWYVFNVVAPYFLVSMAGTYLGIAQAAFDEAQAHLTKRIYTHSGFSLSQISILQHKLGKTWANLERTRQLIYHAAKEGDLGTDSSLLAILSAKAEVAHSAVDVINEAMTLTGGIAYRENSKLANLLLDARAAHVMSPTTDLLYTWIGRALLDQPILNEY